MVKNGEHEHLIQSQKLDYIHIRIGIDPTYRSCASDGGKYARLLVQIRKDGTVYSETQIVELENFKSIGELAFEKAVRDMRNEMGWKP